MMKRERDLSLFGKLNTILMLWDMSVMNIIFIFSFDIVLIRKLCFVCFLVGFMVLLSYALLFSSHYVCFGHAYIPMLLCFIECMFGWSFALLCDHCSHFYMTILVYDQVAHLFHIMFTWSQFNCYIILVFLLLALP